MSYGIIRIQKFKRQAVKGIEIHDQRAKNVSHTNADIDFSKSGQNFALEGSGAHFLDEVDKRTAKLQKTVRKDAVVLCQALVTSDGDFFKKLTPEEQRQFFIKSLNFIKKRYGGENIISAVVHMDEKTPHMHVNFTPIRDNKLSAFSIFTRKELSSLQDDFYYDVAKSYGLKRGEKNEIKRKHIKTLEYKKITDKNINDFSIKVEDLEPKIYKKHLFKSDEKEDSLDIVSRIYNEKIKPYIDKIIEIKYENNILKEREIEYKKTQKKYYTLIKGLSKESIDLLQKKSDELRIEQELKEREKEIEKEKKRYHGR